jgi:hypothetical protein
MKTTLIIVSVMVLVLLILVVAGFGYVSYEGEKNDASSKAYADESIPAIVSNWSKDELVKRESPQLSQAASDDQLTTLFEKLSMLGPMESYDGAQGQAHMRISRSGLKVTAAYVAQATFQKSKAEIKINLIQVDGAWLIQGFGVGPAKPAAQ